MYRVETDPDAKDQIDALPPSALSAYAELRVMLEVSPWSGAPINDGNPDGPVRTISFGPEYEGLVTYLIADDRREVHVLIVQWVGFD